MMLKRLVYLLIAVAATPAFAGELDNVTIQECSMADSAIAPAVLFTNPGKVFVDTTRSGRKFVLTNNEKLAVRIVGDNGKIYKLSGGQLSCDSGLDSAEVSGYNTAFIDPVRGDAGYVVVKIGSFSDCLKFMKDTQDGHAIQAPISGSRIHAEYGISGVPCSY